MGHFKEYKSETAAPDGRALGDEWADWDGKNNTSVRTGKSLFLFTSTLAVAAIDALLCFFIYMITPRLFGWHAWLPTFVWILAITFITLSVITLAALVATIKSGRNFFPVRSPVYFFFDLVFSQVFRIASIFGIERDKMGHSFVRVSNALSKSLKTKMEYEKLLILLPRCLAKEELKQINDLKEKYPLEVHTVSGGELARKKVRELRPTAVIGVACERDLVSGIRDVGQKISVIGIPNERPEGPCKNTRIDMTELVEAIEFYVGKSRENIS